jgi:hypothetical protein
VQEFVNKVLKELLKKNGIKHLRGRPYKPSTQGQVASVVLDGFPLFLL